MHWVICIFRNRQKSHPFYNNTTNNRDINGYAVGRKVLTLTACCHDGIVGVCSAPLAFCC